LPGHPPAGPLHPATVAAAHADSNRNTKKHFM
jgi:hypothetical protein